MGKKYIEAEELSRFLSGNSSEEEKMRLNAWINENPERFREFERIWNASAIDTDRFDEMFDAEKDWKKLNFRMKQETVVDSSTEDYSPNGSFEGSGNWQTFMRLAAVFLIACFIGLVAYYYGEPPVDKIEQSSLREVSTELGQRVNLTLSDGTEVLLDADSKMRLPRIFANDKREVFLEGQAYFNVTKNTDKPFIIHSANTQTRVLGTSFAVRAYPNDKHITVAVEEGRVAFQSAKSKAKETEINSKEFAQYDIITERLETKKMDDAGLYLGWVDGYLKFKETPMAEVAKELERRYGISVTFADQDVKNQPLTAMLKSRSIQNVLDVISMSLDINYELNENQVVFRQ